MIRYSVDFSAVIYERHTAPVAGFPFDPYHAMPDLPHFDDQGNARMVDVGDKAVTRRTARASAKVVMAAETMTLIKNQMIKKGDVLNVARIASIMGVKKTSELIPMCHPLNLDSVDVDFQWLDDQTLKIETTVSATERTGVEMEALTAATVAALTVYDMCKSADRAMRVSEIRLEEKSGGKSGHFAR